MAISNITTTATNDMTIGASGNDRVLIVTGTKGGTFDSVLAFNGTAPTGIYHEETTRQAVIAYWLDADLPSAAGTYTYTDSDILDEALIYAEGVEQATPSQNLVTTDLTNGSGSGAETERLLTLTSGSNDDLRVFAFRNGGTLGTPYAGQTIIPVSNSSSVVGYTQSQNDVGIKASLSPDAANAVLFKAAAEAGLTIDSTDASMQRNTDFEVVCSNATTAPTTGNTTLTNGNDTLTPSSVTGSDPYTLTFPVGDLTKQVDATGYDWTLEITPDEP